MTDPSASKTRSIPSWQLTSNNSSSAEQKPSEPQKSNEETSKDGNSSQPEKTELLEQAMRFLQDESIRDAPTDRKVAFLESKGLRNDDIQKLLGVSRNTEATKGDTKSSNSVASSQLSSSPPTQSESQRTQPTAQLSSGQSASSPSRSSVPPIITYPEFLMQASKPPPLITLQGVLYTLYGAAGLAASIYGASKYVVTPMLETLTSARLELSEKTKQNLDILNEKLERNVSVVPTKVLPTQSVEEKSDEDSDSVTSDPTELFHRDIATQTTPEISSTAANYESSLTPSDSDEKPGPEKTLEAQLKSLETISSRLKGFLSDDSDSSETSSKTRDRVSELQTFLDSLTYSTPTYLSSSLYGAYGDTSRSGSFGTTSKEDDAINSLRSEIRSVKGTLLSARNFPSGSGLRTGVSGMAGS